MLAPIVFVICIACSTRTLDLGNIFDQFFCKWNYNHDIIPITNENGLQFMLALIKHYASPNLQRKM